MAFRSHKCPGLDDKIYVHANYMVYWRGFFFFLEYISFFHPYDKRSLALNSVKYLLFWETFIDMLPLIPEEDLLSS